MQENREMANQGPQHALPPPPGMTRRNSSNFAQSARSSMSSDRPFDLGQLPTLPPPRPSSEASNESERRGSRTLASVHSMLNPSGYDELERRNRRRSAAQMEEESPLVSPTMANIPSGRPSSSGGRSGATSPPPGLSGKQVNPRRILTPISPTLHRTTSLSRIVTGTIDAASTPFLSPDTTMSTAEPTHMSTIPPLHTFPGPLMPQRQSFSYPQASTASVTGLTRRKSVSMIPSARASPSPSTYSSYTQSGQASPSLNPQSTAPTPPGSFSLAPSPVVGPLKVVAPVIMDPEFSHHIPLPPGSQTAYELMTISTSKGSAQIPVEVHVASRQADEKRKRNAGASARFRQRRKEKEREANSTIERLRQELQYMTEDCDYYKSERNRLMDILKETPGWERHQPRSPSPSATRRPLSSRATSSVGGNSGAVSPRSPPPSSRLSQPPVPESERNTRRRLDIEQYSMSLPKPDSSIQPGFPSPFPPFHSVAGSPQHSTFPPVTSGPPTHHNHRLPMVESKPPVPSYGQNWPGSAPSNGHA